MKLNTVNLLKQTIGITAKIVQVEEAAKDNKLMGVEAQILLRTSMQRMRHLSRLLTIKRADLEGLIRAMDVGGQILEVWVVGEASNVAAVAASKLVLANFVGVDGVGETGIRYIYPSNPIRLGSFKDRMLREESLQSLFPHLGRCSKRSISLVFPSFVLIFMTLMTCKCSKFLIHRFSQVPSDSYGRLYPYDKAYDRVNTKNEKPLQIIDRIRYNTTTSDDPVIQQVSAYVV